MTKTRTTDVAPSDRNIVALLQRVVDLLVQLIGNKIELASTEVRDTAQDVGRRAIYGAVGALLATIAVMLLALAAVEALAPLVTSRALRLVLVATPFLVGGWGVARRARSDAERGLARPPANDRDHHRDDRQHQQDVQPGTERIPAHHPEQPQREQQPGDHPQHAKSLL
jgi:uncharacterized membrane protein YqjE